MKIKVYVVDVKLPRWARRALVFGAVPALILGLAALVHAMSVEQFNEGDILTAKSLNDRFNAVVEVWPWQSYTPSVISSGATGTSTTNSKGWYRRVGDTVEINLSTDISPCIAGGQLRWSLPTDIRPDTTRLPYNYALIGHGTLEPATGLQVYAQGSGSTYVAVDYLNSDGGGMGCPTPSTAAVKKIRLAFSFPVVGWTVTGR